MAHNVYPQYGAVTVPTAIGQLDRTGATIPDTSAYTIPPGSVVYMSPSGDDAALGTEGAPVKSLGTALSKITPGGTIVMRGGEHRTTGNIEKSCTVMAYPGEKPWFNGSDVVPGGSWTNKGGGKWEVLWNTPSFCGGTYYADPSTPPASNTMCAAAAAIGGPNYVIGADPMAVFVNGGSLSQVLTEAAVTAGSFYHDWLNKKIVIGVDPSTVTVEITKRMSVIISGTADPITMKGIGFHRFACSHYNEGSSASTSSALYVGGRNLVKLYQCVFSWNSGAGVSVNDPRPGSEMVSCVASNNAGNGANSKGTARAWSQADGVNDSLSNQWVIDSCYFYGNNREYFDDNKNVPSKAAAGIKLTAQVGCTVRNCIFEANKGAASGIWFDIDNSFCYVYKNVARDNGEHGIYYEISSNGWIVSNLLKNNGRGGIVSCSSNTKIWNNTVLMNTPGTANTLGIWIYNDGRGVPAGVTWPWYGKTKPGGGTYPGVGYPTSNVELVNNVVSAPIPNSPRDGAPFLYMSSGQPATGVAWTQPEEFFSLCDYNSYLSKIPPPTQRHMIYVRWGESQQLINNPAGQQAKTGEANSTWQTASDYGSMFTDYEDGDFSILNGSPAHLSGTALTADIASLLGLSTGAIIDRGAYTWAAAAPSVQPTPWSVVDQFSNVKRVNYRGVVRPGPSGPWLDERKLKYVEIYDGWLQFSGGGATTVFTAESDGGSPTTDYSGVPVIDGGQV